METTPVDELESDQKLVSSSGSNSPEDVYDIFRDPPAAGSGQFNAMLQPYYYDHYHLYDPYDPQLSSPALTWASSGHTDGSMNGMK